MTPHPAQIGGYRVIDVLGRGGMGVVYRASDPGGEDLAVKTVRVATESTLASIRREIQTLRELRHPGVVAIRDHGVADGVPWYAMDLLRGRTLRDDLRAWFPAPASVAADAPTLPPDRQHLAPTVDLRRPRARAEHAAVRAASDAATTTRRHSLAHIATLFRKICEPLAYVHGRGVIHRDLSPANIFLTDADQPVLFDFGLAAQFRTDSARDVLAVGGGMRGTAHYMAPEQARGEIVDARADVYAVGCMLFEALTGRPPFLGESPIAVALQHVEAAPLPPSHYAAEVPAAFDELVLRLLAKAPRDRIGYAEDVATALERLGAAPSLVHDVSLQPRSYTYRPGLAGRTQLIAAHDAFLDQLAAGGGGCAALIGESGVGKTRLAGEIATRAIERDVRVITGECEPIGVAHDELRAAPLHPLRPLLRAIADRCRDDPAVAERLLGGSAGLLAVYEPALAVFAPPQAEHLEPAAVRFRVLAALRDALAELAREAPLLLVLDDLQWVDELTLAFLRSLGGDFLVDHGAFVLTTLRAEETTAEIDATLAALGATRLTVPRLDRAAIGAMVRDMLALEDDAPTLTEFVAARSEGNPLFAAEYVRAAVDEGVLHRDAAGRWRLALRDSDSFDELPTPGSVQSLVHRRLRSLPDAARELTLAAAVLGRSCMPDVLVAVAAIDEELARTAVAELIQRHVFEDLPDGGLRFVHDKLREQAYAELDEPTRRALHRRAARPTRTSSSPGAATPRHWPARASRSATWRGLLGCSPLRHPLRARCAACLPSAVAGSAAAAGEVCGSAQSARCGTACSSRSASPCRTTRRLPMPAWRWRSAAITAKPLAPCSPGSAAAGTWSTVRNRASTARVDPHELHLRVRLSDRARERMNNVVVTSVRAHIKNAVFDAFPGVRRRGPSTSRRVALTFDDGPDHLTERYLDMLDQLGVPATFFLVGGRAASRPDLVREYRRRGHQLAGHGYDHKRFNQLGRRELLEQCARTETALGGQLSGRPWVRPPHGSLDATSLVSLVAAGYTVAMWSLDSRDYSTTSSRDIVRACAGVTAGDVLLLHEGQQWTLDALPNIVAALQAAGLECVTMHDLFAN